MSDALDKLSRREREVLALIAKDLTNRAIAERLVISVETVQTHVRHILEKLNVRSRHQAADILALHCTSRAYDPVDTLPVPEDVFWMLDKLAKERLVQPRLEIPRIEKIHRVRVRVALHHGCRVLAIGTSCPATTTALSVPTTGSVSFPTLASASLMCMSSRHTMPS